MAINPVKLQRLVRRRLTHDVERPVKKNSRLHPFWVPPVPYDASTHVKRRTVPGAPIYIFFAAGNLFLANQNAPPGERLTSKLRHSRENGASLEMIVFYFHQNLNCQPVRLLPAAIC